ncbi:MAG: ferredoxin-thioredoxin reductase catalytic domain-containing protein [Candidatus Scalinduaceae bacterium]
MGDGINQAEEDIRKSIEQYVDDGPYELNPDQKKVDKVIRSLAKRKLKYGYQYCPCRMISGDKEIDAKTICPCEYHIEEIKQDDICCCDLFVSPNYKTAPAI